MKVPPPPKPQPSFSAILGARHTGKLRLRPILFGLLVVVEELIEYEDGRKQWERIWYPHEIGSEE